MNTEAPLKPHTGISLSLLNKLLGEAQNDHAIPRRAFKAPDLPPGVVPNGVTPAVACDAAQDMNGWLNGQPGFCGLGFPGYSYLAELSQRSEYRAPAEVIAQEMTREWIELTGAPEAKLKEMNQCMEDMNVRGSMEELAIIDGQFGRAQLSINVKGQLTDQRRKLPLVVDLEGRGGVTKGSLLGFKPIEPIWSTPNAYNSIDPTRDDFYAPQWWYVVGKQTHASRLLTFVGHPMPDILKPAYNFSGLSLSQLVEPYVVRWLKTVDSVNRMISMYSTSGILTNMQATLAGDDEGPGGSMDVFKRMALFTQMRDNRGLLMLDKASEEWFQFNTPLSGLDKLQAQAQEHMAAPTHIPLVKLTGVTPSGLNASSEGEIQVFYDYVKAVQQSFYNRHLTTVLRIIQLHLWGKIDPDIKHIWVPLNSPTDKEESEMRKADGDRDASYVTNGIVEADEVRERLRMDKRSGYSFLVGDAPPPPLEQEAVVQEEGKQADHERSEQSAEAAHQREKETDLKKVALDGSWEETKHPRDAGGRFGSGGSGATSKPKLTSTEKTWLDNYSGDAFLKLNKELREGKTPEGSAVQHLDSAIAKGTVTAGFTLFRGMDHAGAKALFGGSIELGQSIADKAYASTSKSAGVASNLAGGGVMLKISVTHDAPGLDMQDVARAGSEQETLLPRGAKMTVTRITKSKAPGSPVVVEVSYGA